MGPLGYEENIDDPESSTSEEEIEQTCATAGRMKCHVKSSCHDQPEDGFCCTCQNGYYGNGYNCLKNDIPLRVTGNTKGSVNSVELNAQFQSYVSLVDGRSYSAVSPLPAAIGHLFQLLPNLGESIGWLFAKTADDRPNGYQLTGGIFNQTTVVRFATGETIQINYQFKGLNMWDQLTVDMDIYGQLPGIPEGVRVRVADTLNTYVLQDRNTLSLVNERTLEIPDHQLSIGYTINEEIHFESCPYKVLELVNNQLMERVHKTSVSYEPRDQALRVNMLNKVGDFSTGVNPCNEGAVCGENSICIASPDTEIGYECQCKNGYTVGGIENGIAYCVDINECDSLTDNICNVNAECVNVAGGYACICRAGYAGNGYQCVAEEREDERAPEQDPQQEEHDYHTQRPEEHHHHQTTTTAQPYPSYDVPHPNDCTDESCNYVPPEEQAPGKK